MVDAPKSRVGDEHLDERLVGDGAQQVVNAAVSPPAPIGVEARVDAELRGRVVLIRL
ncbi:hypothetical protein PV963_29050 [Streptomyces coeruleorubidus]|nr:hypothetical protein [Streptomyces coeruleorubidus]WDV54117.1 hypothetical protein PV963_29050 [Streptomyces coeruleorubidus]